MVVPSAVLLTLLPEQVTATALHSATIWVWHLPPLFDAALTNRSVHMAQHVSFLVTAMLFWWTTLNSSLSRRGVAAFHLFVTMLALTVLGALLTLSSHSLYLGYEEHRLFSLSPLEDQQLAGLIMWVPGCAIYAVAALVLLGQWIANSSVRAGPLEAKSYQLTAQAADIAAAGAALRTR
jgi:cytochrome c oxidase assembly factor CtaG